MRNIHEGSSNPVPRRAQSCYICAPFVKMRAHPEASAEVVSEAIYSERVEPLSFVGDWTEIITSIDNYRGWVKGNCIVTLDSSSTFSSAQHLIVNRLSAHLYTEPDTIYGPLITLPLESRLEPIGRQPFGSTRWIPVRLIDGTPCFVQRGDVDLYHKPLEIREMCDFSLRFLGLPYTWGGRSSFGYDCSGFIQMLFRQRGVLLPRDSGLQCHWKGGVEIGFESIQSGDLVFFGHSPEAIRHVGLALDNSTFIHTCAVVEDKPYVRISHFTDPEWNGKGYYKYRTARHTSCIS